MRSIKTINQPGNRRVVTVQYNLTSQRKIQARERERNAGERTGSIQIMFHARVSLTQSAAALMSGRWTDVSPSKHPVGYSRRDVMWGQTQVQRDHNDPSLSVCVCDCSSEACCLVTQCVRPRASELIKYPFGVDCNCWRHGLHGNWLQRTSQHPTFFSPLPYMRLAALLWLSPWKPGSLTDLYSCTNVTHTHTKTGFKGNTHTHRVSLHRLRVLSIIIGVWSGIRKEDEMQSNKPLFHEVCTQKNSSGRQKSSVKHLLFVFPLHLRMTD